MKKNECFPMTAGRLGADLEGVCIYEGMPVFVPGLLPGETATVLSAGQREKTPPPTSLTLSGIRISPERRTSVSMSSPGRRAKVQTANGRRVIISSRIRKSRI